MAMTNADAPAPASPRWVLHGHEMLASTSDEARRLALQGAPEGTAVWARVQSAGRGRHGRRWSSPAGNLHLTVVLRDVGRRRASEVGFVAALAVAAAVDAVVAGRPVQEQETLLHATRVRLKWPNDVLLGGAKLAGLLLEVEDTAAGPAVLLGIGVNLRHFPPDAGYAATSLHAAGVRIEPETMLPLVLDRLGGWLDTWRRDGFATVRAAWLQRGHRPGEALRVSGPDGRVDAAFVGLGVDGALLARVDGVVRQYRAGELLAG